jgi:hypothetical protein
MLPNQLLDGIGCGGVFRLSFLIGLVSAHLRPSFR